MTDGSGEDDDNDYTPPKRAHPEPPSPGSVFGIDGEENIEDIEQGEALVSHKIHLSSSLTNYRSPEEKAHQKEHRTDPY